MTAAIHAFEEELDCAERIAAPLGIPVRRIGLRRFPDGEVMPIVSGSDERILLYRPLHRPNEKLVALGLASDAFRRAGAARLTLVAPYLCYLRQDAVFAPGQPLSRDVVARLLGGWFDRLVTVEAHLHRTPDLSAAFAPLDVVNLPAAEPLAGAFIGGERPIVCGPDAESEAWVRRLADRLGAETLVFAKSRLDDERVSLHADDLARVQGRRVVLVDDVCSTGGTLATAVAHLVAAGADRVEVGVVHALFDEAAERRLRSAGAARIVSTDSVPHSSNAAPLAGLLADALRNEAAR